MSDNSVIEDKNQIDYKELAHRYLLSLEEKFPESFMTQFCEVADGMKLNPFLNELHIISYENKNKKIIHKYVTGYMVYIKRADRSGKLDGWEVTSTGNGINIVSTIVIYRKDWQKPFKHSARLRECAEFYPDGNMKGSWQKMPTFMCEKVAISQGFRLCFPDELAGMPYTPDELPESIATETIKNENLEKDYKQNQETKLKGGPSTLEEKQKIIKLMNKTYPDSTQIFTPSEKEIFASCRKSTYTAQELIDEIEKQIEIRLKNVKGEQK